MSVYPPPAEFGVIFNPIDWNTEIGDNITIEYLNANYLKFPVAQGLETFIGTNNQSTTDCQDDIEMNTNKITGCGEPTSAQDVATKNYVDSRPAESLSATLLVGNSAGATQINMNSQKIINCLNPTNAQDVATKNYVDNFSPSISLPYIRGSLSQQTIQTGTTNDAFNMTIDSVYPSGTTFGQGQWLFSMQINITTDNAFSDNCPSCTCYVQFYNATPVVFFTTQQAGSCYYDDVARGIGLQNTNITMCQLINLTQDVAYTQLRISAGNTTGSNHDMYFTTTFQAFKVSSNF
jgi:hypothetical protein